jgi:hypothetical protein
MVNPMDDIARQARQGSVAAIIQVLNEKLADSGVRTRAIVDDNGILQILCEAARVEQLEQSILVHVVRHILESISPRNIRRVNINSRIVREQQLLWLEEITRDPENQLLWSQEITLPQHNPIKQFIKDLQAKNNDTGTIPLPKPPSSRRPLTSKQNQQQNQMWRAMLGGASLCLFLLLFGWAVYGWLGGKINNPLSAESTNSVAPTTKNQQNPTNESLPSGKTEDPFIAAVRIANQASATGRTAQTSAQWLDLAARWQRAADLMAAVPPTHSRYKEAQIRTKLYREYSQSAQKEAQKKPS